MRNQLATNLQVKAQLNADLSQEMGVEVASWWSPTTGDWINVHSPLQEAAAQILS